MSLLLGLVCAGFALFGTGLLAAALWVLADGAAGDPERLGPLALLLGGGGALAFAAAGGLAYVLLHRRIERPLAGLARQVRTLSHAPLGQVVEPPAGQALEPLAGDLVALSRELIRARRDMTKAVAAAGARLDEQKGWLEAILLALGKGVIVCNAEHRILLYNQAARQILKDPAALGLDQSLFGLIGRAPVLHALERLKLMARDGQVAADQRMATLVCATLERKILLDARLTLILGPDREPAGYVLNFDDFSREMLEVTRRDALLQAATEGLRAPVANLRAAAETLVAHPTLSAEQRRAFEAVVASESEAISAEIDRLAERRHELSSGRWPMAEVYSADLISCIVQHLAERRSLKLTMVGIPIWLYCDSHSLMLAIEALIERLAEHAGVEAFDIGARQEGSRAYLDMVWDGEPVPSRTLESWLDTPLEGALGCETIRQALDLHGSDLWSRAQVPGRAVVHLPVAAAGDIERDQIAESLPPRPEFYDFDLLQRRDTPGALRARPLRELTFVV
ncbi:MAG TPA: hypothetical protein VLL72_05080, partial [Kiloniellales bacterium]|nr:hypothetical protein [Kiloniellales bacterium]